MEEVREANQQLRRGVGSGLPPLNAPKREVKEHAKKEQKRLRLEQRARSALAQIIAECPWCVEEMREGSPVKPNAVVQEQWKDLLSIYKPEDVLWIGDKYDSGEGKECHFQQVEDWLKGTTVLGPLTCPATFKVNSFSRSNDNVLVRRHLVVESDVLAKHEIAAVFKWLQQRVGLVLRAVVDTAGKSLHGWFETPKKAILEELEVILPQLGCDPGLFRASQPCRIPGAARGDKFQTLLYLDRDCKAGVVKRPSEVLPLPKLFFSDYAQCFWRESADGTWQKINEKALETELKAQGVSFEEEPGELICEGQRVKRDIQRQHNLAYAGRLAGYQAGPLRMYGRNILVTDGVKLVTPKRGHYPLITHLIDGLFKSTDVDQTPYVYGWIKRAYTSLKTGNFAPGQALAIAGPKGAGKSLFQNLITEMIGGRVAKPFGYMNGRTSFNSGMFTAEHLMIEDEAASTRLDARRNLGAMLKAVVANETQTCYTKHIEEITLKPFWRLSITMNMEPEDLMVLPPFDDGIADKIILLKAARVERPMSTDTAEQRKAYWEALVGEIPAFLADLEHWDVPDELRDGRWGVKTYHHPDLLEKVGQLQPEYRLLALIDSNNGNELFQCLETEWEGTALKLEAILTDKDWSLGYQGRNLLSYQSTCGTLLGRLAAQNPERVSKVRVTNGHTVWRITKGQSNN